MTKEQERALTAYIRFYRSLAVTCSSLDCYVFPNSTNQTRGCCMKLDFSSLGKVIRQVAILAGVDDKITSRILRSQITALWESDADPAWWNKVADQCLHSLDTAARYYEYSSKVKPGLDVINNLNRICEATENEPDIEDEGEDDNSLSLSVSEMIWWWWWCISLSSIIRLLFSLFVLGPWKVFNSWNKMMKERVVARYSSVTHNKQHQTFNTCSISAHLNWHCHVPCAHTTK